MVNFCLKLLEKKYSNERKEKKSKYIYNYLYKKVFKTTDFKIKNNDVKLTFKLLDKIYFNNKITNFFKKSKSSITFSASHRLKKTAGHCKWKTYLDKYGDVNYIDYEIEISKPIIDSIFKDKKIKSLKINGLHCFDKLECYINLYQHEITHLLINIFCLN